MSTVSLKKVICLGLGALFVTSTMTGCYQEAESTDLKTATNNHKFDHYQLDLLFGDFKGLSTDTLKTNAIPLKVAVAAMVTKENQLNHSEISFKTYEATMKKYGFIISPKIENLDSKIQQPEFKYPMGIIRGQLEMKLGPIKTEVEIANITCASCHAGRLYDSNGNATNKIWLGLPNTSINLEGYTTEVYESLKFIRTARKEFLNNLKTLFPDISAREYSTTSQYLFPELDRQITEIESQSDKVLSFFNGPAGAANAIGSFKRVFGIYYPGYYTESENGFVNIPDMSYRAFKNYFTVDGIYSPLNINPATTVTEADITEDRLNTLGTVASVFPVPVQGIQIDKTLELIPSFQKIMKEFIKNYKAPVFPGSLDKNKALAGEKIYRQNCLKCHGEFSAGIENVRLISFPNKKIPADKIGTDTRRVDVITDKLYNKMANSWIKDKLQISIEKSYMAPILSGVWATAPYLHNGSVPTLWALMNPKERPSQFYVGGHKLDYQKVGISYPEGYAPFSQPTLVDTTKPGMTNTGHEKPFDPLSAEDKINLIEYLKLL